jgi:hypothetical protein
VFPVWIETLVSVMTRLTVEKMVFSIWSWKKYLVTSPRVGSIPWHTDWPTVSCNVTSIMTMQLSGQTSTKWTRHQDILTDWLSAVKWLWTGVSNLALQVGGVSDETVMYGYGFCMTRTIEWLHCKLQTRPLVREGASQKQDRKFQTATFPQEVISSRKSHKGARYQDILTDWPSVVK